MKTLLAMTHNFVGPDIARSVRNLLLRNDREAHIIASETLLALRESREVGSGAFYGQKIELVRNPALAENKPDVLLLYIGAADPDDALVFTELFSGAEIHHVVSDDAVKAYRAAYHKKQWGYSPILHISEPTGNLTMQKLIDEFLDTGAIVGEMP